MAVIAVFRDIRFPSQQLQVAGIDRGGQVVHLIACVVDVIFCLHVAAGGAQQVDEGAAVRCAAAVADVKGTCRIGADIFDLYRVFFTQRRFAVIGAGG